MDQTKAKEQLIAELEDLRQELESLRGGRRELLTVERELAADEEIFAAIAKQRLMGIVLVQDFCIVYTNQKYIELSEYSAEEILRWSMQDLLKIVHADDRDFVIDQLSKKQAGETAGTVASYCYRGITRSGQVKWLEQHSMTVQYQGRSADLVMLIDVTERHAAEDELRAAKHELEQRVAERTAELRRAYDDLQEMDRLKDSFVASISHELRTPLVSAKGYAELLLEQKDLNRRDQERVKRIHGSILRLQAIIDDLLDISRLQSGVMELALLPVEVADAVTKSIETLKPRLKQKGMRITRQIPAELPPILADAYKLQSVLLNLLDNAIKFSADKSQITVTVALADEAVVISVCDQGIGIAAADLGKVFDRFYQVDSSPTRLYGGAGIGLSLVREIVKMHGGEVWVESVQGEGATFSFSLPIAGPKATVQSRGVKAEEAPAEPGGRSRPRR